MAKLNQRFSVSSASNNPMPKRDLDFHLGGSTLVGRNLGVLCEVCWGTNEKNYFTVTLELQNDNLPRDLQTSLAKSHSLNVPLHEFGYLEDSSREIDSFENPSKNLQM